MTALNNHLSPDDEAATPLRAALNRYAEPLLRQIAERLLRLRVRRTPAELTDRILASMRNPASLDRRLRELPREAHQLLALVAMTRQPSWRLSTLMELLNWGMEAGSLELLAGLFETGFLYPLLGEREPPLTGWSDWMSRGEFASLRGHVPLAVAERARAALPQLPPLAKTTTSVTDVREADGLEFPLRLAVLTQQLRSTPLRLTQQAEFFKKDQERLSGESILAAPMADELAPLPQPGHLLVELGLRLGLLERHEGLVQCRELPANHEETLNDSLSRLWSVLPLLEAWDARRGWVGFQASPSPQPSLIVLTMRLLGQLDDGEWASPDVVASWLEQRHPILREQPRSPEWASWARCFLLGIAYPLRLVAAARDEAGEWVVRLSATGRGLLGLEPAREMPAYQQTLLVQPNLELVAYRQGLTPALIERLSRLATWKTLGAACTLQLTPESVYAALQSGWSLEDVVRTLQQHAVREVPATVLQSLRTWANKRERLAVYAAATLLEFATPEDLHAALARGLPATPIAERLAMVPQEADIDYRHFRLAGTRDYGLPPDRCVSVAEDGVTLAVDLARSDLLLETELRRFAEPLRQTAANGTQTYRLTPASLARGRAGGLQLRALEEWFQQRAGQSVPPAAMLLLTGPDAAALTTRRLLIVEVPAATLADGLEQWPATRRLIQRRLGPLALAIDERDLPALTDELGAIGIQLKQS